MSVGYVSGKKLELGEEAREEDVLRNYCEQLTDKSLSLVNGVSKE